MSRLELDTEVRYRTKQINIIKVNGLISAHSTVQCDYYFAFNKDSNIYIVRLDDSVYEFNATNSEKLEKFIRSSDTVKKEMKYSINSECEIDDLLNHEDVIKNWEQFKTNIYDNDYLVDFSQEIIDEIVYAGNKEYYSKDLLLKNSETNLFNKVIFDKYLIKNPNISKLVEFTTQSHFFPQKKFVVACDTVVKENSSELLKYIRNGKPVDMNNEEMRLLYDKSYKEQIGFNFTEYLYDYKLETTVSKHDGLIDRSRVNINERVKNNLQSQVVYELNRVEL